MGKLEKRMMGWVFGSGLLARTEWWPEGWWQRISLVAGGASTRKSWEPTGTRPSGPTLMGVRTLQTKA